VVISDRTAVLNLPEPFLTLSKLAIAAGSGSGPKGWYALIKEFRTAVRSFVESSPVDLTGKQPDAQRPGADRQGDIIL
jgi:hypothetical protein